LLATIILGITFLACQGIEYKYGVTFSWKENVYGSTFFVTTGFHGFHVTFGTLFLWFCLVRALVTTAGLQLLLWHGFIFNFIWWCHMLKLRRKRRLRHAFFKKYEYW
jgi:cytochrome c oxidase subunit 3